MAIIKINIENGHHNIDVKGKLADVMSELGTMFILNPSLVEPFKVAIEASENLKGEIGEELKKRAKAKEENGK